MIKSSGSGFSHWSNKYVLSSSVNKPSNVRKVHFLLSRCLTYKKAKTKGKVADFESNVLHSVSGVSPGPSAVLSWACLGAYWSDPFVLTLSWGDGWQVIIYTHFGKWKWVNGSQMLETLHVSQSRGVIVISVFLHQSPSVFQDLQHKASEQKNKTFTDFWRNA